MKQKNSLKVDDTHYITHLNTAFFSSCKLHIHRNLCYDQWPSYTDRSPRQKFHFRTFYLFFFCIKSRIDLITQKSGDFRAPMESRDIWQLPHQPHYLCYGLCQKWCGSIICMIIFGLWTRINWNSRFKLNSWRTSS